MLKWLDKVLPGRNTGTAEDAPESVAETPTRQTGQSEQEPPLAAPVISLEQTDPFSHNIVARQVIVNRAYHPIGYEFSLRTDSTHGGVSTASMLAGVINRLGQTLASGRQTWLRLSDRELADAKIEPLLLIHAVLIIQLTDAETDTRAQAMEVARILKAGGAQLALADWAETEAHIAWLPLCDFVEVRNTTHNPVDIGGWPEKLVALCPGVQTIAAEVDSWEELEFCHRQKYDFFRGHFLTHRENWPRQPRLNQERALLIDLLNRLHLGAELAQIADQLKQSPELSYRLLRYINSAGVGAGARVASIQQGLLMLGRDKIYRWLTVLLFTSGQGKSLDRALLEQALVRARLMELLCQGKFSGVQADEVFVVGIFSLIDMLLQLPMSVALEPLKLPTAVADALLEGETSNSEYAPYLALALACEESDRDVMKRVAADLAIPLSIINAAHLDALVWTQTTLSEK